MNTRTARRHASLRAALLLAFAAGAASAQHSAFTYQGVLTESGTPVQGMYDLTFKLFDAPTNGSQVGPTLCGDNTNVTDGVFAMEFDFGTLPSRPLYLEVSIRQDADGSRACGEGDGFTTMSARVPLTSAPQARQAAEAAAADSAETAANVDLIAGHDSSFYLSAANITGTIPTASLSGTYSNTVAFSNSANVLTGDGSHLTNVRVASTPASTDSKALGSQPASFYLDASNITSGTIQPANFTGTYSQPVQFTNPGNYYVGSGGGITGLSASQISGSVYNGFLAGTYSNQLTFSNTTNGFTGTFTGNGAGLTSLNAAAITGRFSSSQMPIVPPGHLESRIFADALASVSPGMSQFVNTGWVAIPWSGKTVTIPFNGTAIMTWRVSGFSDRPAGYRVTPVVGSTTILFATGVPWFFNRGAVHEQNNGTISFPVTAGTYSVYLAVTQGSVDGQFNMDYNDCINWTLTVVR